MTAATYRFGVFELQPDQRRLLASGRPVALGQRAFDLLQILVERRERLVPKGELLDLVWPDLVVEENNLQVQISNLRKVLGTHAIATIPGRGYRFTVPVDGANVESPAIAKIEIAPATTPRTNVPREVPALYGRDADLAALRELIGGHRLVTIVGAGGIGKSRLAQAITHAISDTRPDGAWMVELAGLSDPARLANAVAQVLDVKMPGQRPPLDELTDGLGVRDALLVLDNCEHLLDAVAALVEGLVQSAPDITVLATSQEPLRLPEEQQYRVMPLAVPSGTDAEDALTYGAVALFEARVRAAAPRFALTRENAPLAIDICRRLDGLPLAIELAAARVATLGLAPVRDKLDARFRLLTGGARSTLRRHQTLRAALEWSHNLLNDAEKAVFRRLGAFAGGFTSELAQAVAADAEQDEWAVLDHLGALVDKSLVVADAGDTPRYRLLESARAFALEQLAAADTADTLRRHAVAMRDFLARVDDANLDGELRTDQYAARVLPELDNLRAARAWAMGDDGDARIALALAAHSGALIDYAAECAEWLPPMQALAKAEDADPAVAARYFRAVAAGNMARRIPLELQIASAERALALYRTLEQPRRVFSSLIQLSRHIRAPRYRAMSVAVLDEARALLRPEWPAEFHIVMLRRDGELARFEGRSHEALAIYRDTVRVSAASRDWRLEVMARSNLADMIWDIGSIDEAARIARALAADLRQRPAAYTDMDVLFANLMGILSEAGEIEEATAAAREALPIMRRSRNYFVDEWVYLFWRRGQHDVATLLLGASDAEVVRYGMSRQQNEERLVAQARAALAAAVPADAFVRSLAAGAALRDVDIAALIAEALGPAPGTRG